MVDLRRVNSLPGWAKMRCEIESAVLGTLGVLPKEREELQVKTLDEVSFNGYVRRRINYFVDDWERVSAWLFVPEGKELVPGILCCHQSVPQGKDEPAGVEGDPTMALAQHLVERGYATLAPDVITAGERVSPGLDPYDTKCFYKDHSKMSALGKMLWDHVHALDVLCDTRRVDQERLGVIGHELGGCNALFLAAFDERVQACVASSAFTRFGDDLNPERWARESGFVFLPRLREAIKKREFPFDWEHVLALVAPSPMLLVTDLNDPNLPNTKSCEKSFKLARRVYALLGEEDAIDQFVHSNSDGMRPEAIERTDEWFERWL